MTRAQCGHVPNATPVHTPAPSLETFEVVLCTGQIPNHQQQSIKQLTTLLTLSILVISITNKKAQLTHMRQRHHSKMAVSRHLGYYGTTNSTIRSIDPENPSLEPQMEWIGCTVCEIFAFKLYCDLETGVHFDTIQIGRP